MRRYPFFVTEVLFLLLFLMTILAAFFFNGSVSYAAALVAGIIFIVVSAADHKKYKDFESSVRKIDGLRSWETDFLSVGRLIFDYKGERITYSTCIGGSTQSYIPVTYRIQLRNGSDVTFDLAPGGKWLGEYLAKGDRRFLDTLRQEIAAFTRKYAIKRMRNSEGVLEVSVQLDFIANQPPPPDKLEDMTAFLSELLLFGYSVNGKLKPKKMQRKRRKRQ